MRQLTLDQLAELKLSGMAHALKEQLAGPAYLDLSFDERFELLVDAEIAGRHERRLQNRVKKASLRVSARIEDIDHQTARSLDRRLVGELASCRWLREKRNVILVGPTGVGKTYLASALTFKACQDGFSARYQRLPRLLQELEIARADGTYKNKLASLARIDLVILDDWLVSPLSDLGRRDIFEILEDRYDRRSLMVCSQLPQELWHDAIGDPMIADAILDRLVHNAYRLELKGESLRKTKALKGLDPVSSSS
jgi:DNA replication protein DnaC